MNKNVISSADVSIENIKRGIPNYNYKKRKLNFIKSKTLLANQSAETMVSGRVLSILMNE